MKKRKLIGANNVKIRESTNIESTDVELKGYTDVYAVEMNGNFSTLKETYIKDKLYETTETDEDPYSLDFDFVENGEWEEVKKQE